MKWVECLGLWLVLMGCLMGLKNVIWMLWLLRVCMRLSVSEVRLMLLLFGIR